MGWRTSVSLSPKLGWKKQEDGGEAECLPPWDFAMKTGTLWDFPGGAVVENSPASAGDTGSSPGPGRSHMPWSN